MDEVARWGDEHAVSRRSKILLQLRSLPLRINDVISENDSPTSAEIVLSEKGILSVEAVKKDDQKHRE